MSDNVELNIRRWDPRRLEFLRTHGHSPKVLVLGKTGSGKSTLIQDILFYIRRIQSGLVFCPTETSLVDYRLMFPETFIHEAWDSKLVHNFVKLQKRLKKKDPDFHQILMLDDCLYDKGGFIKDPITRFLFFNGRHHNISMIISAQYMMDMPPDLRNNIDFVIALRDNVHSNREKLWKNFFGVIPTADAFHQIMQRCTAGYNAIVLDNTSRSANIDDCIFYYAADARMDPCRVLRLNGDDTVDVEFTEDNTRVASVNRALIKKMDEFDRSPLRPGETIKAKFKRTWLSLPPHKRHCFHRTMWEFHKSRFNPEYDDDDVVGAAGGATAGTGGAAAGAAGAAAGAAGAAGGGAGQTAEMFRKTRKGERKLIVHTI